MHFVSSTRAACLCGQVNERLENLNRQAIRLVCEAVRFARTSKYGSSVNSSTFSRRQCAPIDSSLPIRTVKVLRSLNTPYFVGTCHDSRRDVRRLEERYKPVRVVLRTALPIDPINVCSVSGEEGAQLGDINRTRC